MNKSDYKYRFVARVVVEAETAIAVGNGMRAIETDSQVARDVNGLPYIPATSLAGVYRSLVEDTPYDKVFGDKVERTADEMPQGSLVTFTDALIVGEDGSVADGLLSQELIMNDKVLSLYGQIKKREHVRLSHKGVAVDTAKFDNEVVYKGSRFAFMVEQASAEAEDGAFKDMVRLIDADAFRIGGGSRTGLGKLKIVGLEFAKYNLEEQLEAYLDLSSNLSGVWKINDGPLNLVQLDLNRYKNYDMDVQTDGYFIFGQESVSTEVKSGNMTEMVLVWNNEKFVQTETFCLIPGSSIKGALAHRTAYHYNLLTGRYADDFTALVGAENPAVAILFGYTEVEKESGEKQKRGLIFFSDVYLRTDSLEKKIFNHVKIDRYTGGALNSALFNEEKISGRGVVLPVHITLDYKALNVSLLEYHGVDSEDRDLLAANVMKAFEKACSDLQEGRLPLGGKVNHGNGLFKKV